MSGTESSSKDASVEPSLRKAKIAGAPKATHKAGRSADIATGNPTRNRTPKKKAGDKLDGELQIYNSSESERVFSLKDGRLLRLKNIKCLLVLPVFRLTPSGRQQTFLYNERGRSIICAQELRLRRQLLLWGLSFKLPQLEGA